MTFGYKITEHNREYTGETVNGDILTILREEKLLNGKELQSIYSNPDSYDSCLLKTIKDLLDADSPDSRDFHEKSQRSLHIFFRRIDIEFWRR